MILRVPPDESSNLSVRRPKQQHVAFCSHFHFRAQKRRRHFGTSSYLVV
jgi:hypothetical protein